MYIGGKKIENITTVGQLRDALTNWHPDTPVQGSLDDEAVCVQEWEDDEPRRLAHIEISFMNN